MKQLEEVQEMNYQRRICAGAEPEGYNLSYSISLKKFFCFNLSKKRYSEASRFKGGSSLSFPNLKESRVWFSRI